MQSLSNLFLIAFAPALAISHIVCLRMDLSISRSTFESTFIIKYYPRHVSAYTFKILRFMIAIRLVGSSSLWLLFKIFSTPQRCWWCLCCLLSSTTHRSPSPEPIYNSEGKRLNTREYRTRKKIEEERHSLITEMVGLNPDFKPPADYKYDLFYQLLISCRWLKTNIFDSSRLSILLKGMTCMEEL